MTVGELIEQLSKYPFDKRVEVQNGPCYECGEFHPITGVSHAIDGEDWNAGRKSEQFAATVFVKSNL